MRWLHHLEERFVALPPAERAGFTGVALCVMALTIHQVVFIDWMLEDAAITFSYARNAAMGEGFVSWVGGERVEGFSNPSWTLLLALGSALGLSPWMGAKLGGVVFGAVALVAAWRWTQALLPHPWSLVTPLFLALWPPFAIWCASGLENPLFVASLATAAWLTVREAQGAPGAWASLAWGVLAITRPEAALYAAVGAVWTGLFRLRRHGVAVTLRWTALWLLGFAVVAGTWELFAYLYFAWPLPNTYYAKLTDADKFQPWNWDKKGWLYLRRYALETTAGFWSPVLLVAMLGLHTRARRITAAVLIALLVAMVAPDLDWAPWETALPDAAEHGRIVVIAGLVVLMPLATLGREGAHARGLAWCLLAVAGFFTLYSGGDWARGFRWGSMAAVPTAVLFADGTYRLHQWAKDALPSGRWPTASTAVVLATPIIASLIYSGWVRGRTETSPFDVYLRAAYMRGVGDRLDIERPVLLEVDQGAHMWFSGFELIDIAGLTDVSMAHHAWQRAFTDQYVYEERRPDFAHLHGGWATRTKLTRNRAFKEYVEIGGYPISRRTRHVGNHVHRRHLAQEEWDGPTGRAVRYEDGIELTGWQIPTGEAARGGTLWLEVAYTRMRKDAKEDFRTWLVLASGEALFTAELPPAYDYLPVKKWRTRQEVVIGRHRLELPADFPLGPAEVGFVRVGVEANGAAIAPVERPPGTLDGPPRLHSQEVRWAAGVDILPEDQARSRADKHLSEAIAAAQARDCALGEARYQLARRYFAREDDWQSHARNRLASPLARCWAERAGVETDAERAAESFRQSRRWDHREPGARALAVAFANAREQVGDAALAEDDTATAYASYWQALRADPSRSWVRRRAEQARDQLLELD